MNNDHNNFIRFNEPVGFSYQLDKNGNIKKQQCPTCRNWFNALLSFIAPIYCPITDKLELHASAMCKPCHELLSKTTIKPNPDHTYRAGRTE